jgi:hypothetical protein
MKAKHVLAGMAGVFVAALAVIIGQRMSTDAMAVVVGVIFGVAASIPTSLLVVVVTRRAQERGMRDTRGERQQMQPPVIVVNPGGSQSAGRHSGYQSPPLRMGLHSAPARRFHIVGNAGVTVDQ